MRQNQMITESGEIALWLVSDPEDEEPFLFQESRGFDRLDALARLG
jgi:hypothetical protein